MIQERYSAGVERVVAPYLIAAISVILFLSFTAASRSSELSPKAWCGPKLLTYDFGTRKDVKIVRLTGTLTRQKFPIKNWQEDTPGYTHHWILKLDYEIPVLTDILEPGDRHDVGDDGKWVKAREIELLGYRINGGFEKYNRYRNKHVAITGTLWTSHFVWDAAKVQIEETGVRLSGPVRCDGKPLTRH